MGDNPWKSYAIRGSDNGMPFMQNGGWSIQGKFNFHNGQTLGIRDKTIEVINNSTRLIFLQRSCSNSQRMYQIFRQIIRIYSCRYCF